VVEGRGRGGWKGWGEGGVRDGGRIGKGLVEGVEGMELLKSAPDPSPSPKPAAPFTCSPPAPHTFTK